MILFFYGDDTLTPKEKVAKLTERFLSKNIGGTGLTQIDCSDDVTVTDITSALFSASLFTQRRLVVIKDPFSFVASDQREVAAQIAKIQEQDVVVFWQQGTVRKTAVLFKKLMEIAHTTKEFNVPVGARYEAWVAQRLESIAPGTKIAPDATKELVSRIGNDMIQMDIVLMQLAAAADGKAVTRRMVTILTHQHPEANAFLAVEAISHGDPERALDVLKEQLDAGEDAFKLFGLYAYQIRTMLAVADCINSGTLESRDIAKKTELKPFVVTKARSAIQNMSLHRLKRAHALIVNLDRGVKVGTMTMTDALHDLVVRV